MYGGLSSVPNSSNLEGNINDTNKNSSHKKIAFAEWVLAILIPWPCPGSA